MGHLALRLTGFCSIEYHPCTHVEPIIYESYISNLHHCSLDLHYEIRSVSPDTTSSIFAMPDRKKLRSLFRKTRDKISAVDTPVQRTPIPSDWYANHEAGKDLFGSIPFIPRPVDLAGLQPSPELQPSRPVFELDGLEIGPRQNERADIAPEIMRKHEEYRTDDKDLSKRISGGDMEGLSVEKSVNPEPYERPSAATTSNDNAEHDLLPKLSGSLPKDWKHVQNLLPHAWKWDVEYHSIHAKEGGQHGC